LQVFIQFRVRVAPSCEREGLKRRTIVLGARPSGEIKSSIWIDSGFAEHRVAEHGLDLVIGPHILQERGLNLVPEMPPAKKSASVELAQRLVEIHELAQALDGEARFELPDRGHAQGVDDDRGIPEPVEKIVGVGIVSGENWRRDHRSRPGRDALTKPGALFDDLSSRDSAQHRANREARFCLYPVVKRGHATADTKCGLLNPSFVMPSRISGMLMNSFQMRPVR